MCLKCGLPPYAPAATPVWAGWAPPPLRTRRRPWLRGHPEDHHAKGVPGPPARPVGRIGREVSHDEVANEVGAWSVSGCCTVTGPVHPRHRPRCATGRLLRWRRFPLRVQSVAVGHHHEIASHRTRAAGRHPDGGRAHPDGRQQPSRLNHETERGLINRPCSCNEADADTHADAARYVVDQPCRHTEGGTVWRHRHRVGPATADVRSAGLLARSVADRGPAHRRGRA